MASKWKRQNVEKFECRKEIIDITQLSHSNQSYVLTPVAKGLDLGKDKAGRLRLGLFLLQFKNRCRLLASKL